MVEVPISSKYELFVRYAVSGYSFSLKYIQCVQVVYLICFGCRAEMVLRKLFSM